MKTNIDKNKIKFIDFSETFNRVEKKLEFITLKRLFCKRQFNEIKPMIDRYGDTLVLKNIQENIFYTAFSRYLADGTISEQYARYYVRNLRLDTTNDFINSFINLKITDKERELVKTHFKYFETLYSKKLQGCDAIQGIIKDDNYIIFDGIHRAVLYDMLDDSNLNFSLVF
jgi:hypothetical protein